MGTHNGQSRTFRLVLISIFSAIIILQNFIPFLGYIYVGAFSLTLIHITVIIIAIALGPLDGAVIGGIWGLITFIRAFTFPSSPVAPLIFTNPLISVLPRILIGVVAGYTYLALRKMKLFDVGSMTLAALFGSLTNTVLVLGLTYIFYRVPYANIYHMDVTRVLPFLLGIVFTNGIFEAAAACVVSPAVAKVLMQIRQRR
ncbi:ECF transporter S component [Sporolactobacillus pectinivorans]|uniref:ECF transporter S component n=1 Tax=Sporolactobacillus pectinivorans TaxID=1591408 RepID=UPI000C26AE84|nr:ECF transporter S component [Sporolactobacillus pectinivorans]